VFRSLPAPGKARFGLRHALIGEFLWVSERLEGGDRWRQSELAMRALFPGRPAEQVRMSFDIMLGQRIGAENARRARGSAFVLFLMKNRTREYFRETLSWLLGLDAAPPFKWAGADGDPSPFGKGGLWWVWNPGGKLLYESLDPAWQKRAVERKYRTLALCGLVRLAAELRFGSGPASGGEVPAERFEASAAKDPFSGRAYLWDPEKAVVYSVGPDGRDDRGDPTADIALPVRWGPLRQAPLP
jgi:hypothetical protein